MLQCQVCYEAYDLRKHRPKITPCGHTFCVLCLKAYRTACPTCRKSYSVAPDDLTDNFLALEETPDMKLVQRTLWCQTCSATPLMDCIEAHEVCSARAARAKLEDSLSAAILKLDDAVRQEMDVLDTMGDYFTRMVLALKEKARSDLVGSQRVAERGVPDVSAGMEVIAGIEALMADRLQKLSMLKEAREAQIKFRCGDRWLTYSQDEDSDGAQNGVQDGVQDGALGGAQDQGVATQDGEAPDVDGKALLFVTYAMSRLRCRTLRLRTTLEVLAAVQCGNGVDLPDVTIELDEPSSYERVVRHWSKGWKRYSICRGCLESCHAEPFAPQPPDEGDARVERGTLCVGRSSGKYYFILCSDMRSKFFLPLSASFKVVGRVTRNISSLDEAVNSTMLPSVIRVTPKTPVYNSIT